MNTVRLYVRETELSLNGLGSAIRRNPRFKGKCFSVRNDQIVISPNNKLLNQGIYSEVWGVTEQGKKYIGELCNGSAKPNKITLKRVK